MATVFKRTRYENNKIWGVATPGAARPPAKRSYRNKAATLQKAIWLGRDRERSKKGLLDPHAEHRARPLMEHVEAWLKELEERGKATGYIACCRTRLSRLVRECRWATLADIDAESFIRWRGSARSYTTHNAKDPRTVKKVLLSPRAKNHYLQGAVAFLNWARKRGRWDNNPLRHVEKVEEAMDVRRQRRALTEDEIRRLLPLVEEQHRIVYEVSLNTGLRRTEIRELRWGDLHLEEQKPHLTLRAATTKSRRADTLPIRAELVAKLLQARKGAQDCHRVFRHIPTMKQHRRYLKAAHIPYIDDQGRRVDWHALRMTFGTLLSKAGVTPRIAMELMRHSDLRLTLKVYTDPRLFDLASAVERLPSVQPDIEQTPQLPTEVQSVGSGPPAESLEAGLHELSSLWSEVPPAIRMCILSLARASRELSGEAK